MHQLTARYFNQFIGLFLLSLLIVNPVQAGFTKSTNYKDFEPWYFAKYNKIKILPFKAAAVIDATSLEPLYYYQETTTIPAASLVKLFTAGTVIKMSPNWWQKMSFTTADNETDLRQYVGPKDSFSLLKLKTGDQITLEQSFASMLISSANNSANHFSYVWNNRPQFIETMNQLAKDWGMTKTAIVDPSGLSLDNVSTAADLVRAGCYAFQDFMIQFYASKPRVAFTTALGEKKTVAHTVRVLRSYPDRFFGAKTGYLNETGYHLVAGFITPQKRRICVAILSSTIRSASENVLFDLGKWVDEMYK